MCPRVHGAVVRVLSCRFLVRPLLPWTELIQHMGWVSGASRGPVSSFLLSAPRSWNKVSVGVFSLEILPPRGDLVLCVPFFFARSFWGPVLLVARAFFFF